MKRSSDLHNSQKQRHFSKILADNFSVNLLGKAYIPKPKEEKKNVESNLPKISPKED